MRTFLLTATSLLAICASSHAADLRARPLPVRAIPEPSLYMGWSGFYIGVNAGGGIGLGKSDFSIFGSPPFATVNNYLPGAIGGGQAGFNWQNGLSVIGIETDIQASSLKGAVRTPCIAGLCGIPLTASYSQAVPWFGTVRGRVGFTNGGWLIYATGGYAYTRIETDAVATAGPATATFSLHETRNGWTVGAGIEVAFAPGWSARLEYLYLDFGNSNSVMTFVAPPLGDDAHFSMNIVRAGANYRF
jgi:outer membrane immunogenic protein